MHTVDVSEMDLAGEKKESAEKEEEDDGASEIRVVHDMLVDTSEGVENCEGLGGIYSVRIGTGCSDCAGHERIIVRGVQF